MESPAEYVKERHDNIKKSNIDGRSYRGLILTNELKVLLISDPLATKHAAALVVDVGYMSDPDDLPGLAHLCQHMLFMGSKKYPKKDEYDTYISQHAGMNCAEVKLDHTYYYFEVGLGKLHDALERFAQIFIEPLFPQDMIQQEVNNIDIEFTTKYLVDDDNRFYQLRRQFANPTHPFSKFGVGNKQTLDVKPRENGIDVKERLVSFFQEHYSANIMSLCVFSNEDINILEETVAKFFCGILNKKIKAESWDIKSFEKEDTFNKLYMVPKKNINTLVLSFHLNDFRQNTYQALPLSYISHNLQTGGEKSLLLNLEQKGWCSSIIGETDIVVRGLSFFTITFNLTENGMEHIDDIIEFTLMHIKTINNSLLSLYYTQFNSKYKDFTSANFHHSKTPTSLSFIISNAKALLLYPMVDVLIAERVIINIEPESIIPVWNYLVPRNMRVHLISKKYANIANQNEHWYGTMYKEEKIPKKTVNKWSELPYTYIFRIPTKLMLMASRFNIKEAEMQIKSEVPSIIKESRFIKLWHAKDNIYKIPQASMFFKFVSPVANDNPLDCNLNKMFLYLLRDSLSEHINSAQEVDLKVELRESDGKAAIMLGISGCDDKQDVLLKVILERMVNFKFDATTFDVFKEHYINYLNDFNNCLPDLQAVYYLSVLLRDEIWLSHELLNSSAYITTDKLEQFIPGLLSRMHVEGLIYGNITKKEATDVFVLIESTLEKLVPHLTPLTPKQLMPTRDIHLKKGHHHLLIINNTLYENSCTLVYYQAGIQTTVSNVLLKLLVQIISKPCIDTLKDKEQLGYKIVIERHTTRTAHGLMILVVGNKYETEEVEKRISLFIKSMSVSISSMPETEFKKQKVILCTRNTPPQTFYNTSIDYWNEISSQRHRFTQYENENHKLTEEYNITQQLLLQFYNELVGTNTQRKLSVHVKYTPTIKIPDNKSTGNKKAETDNKNMKPIPSTSLDDKLTKKNKIGTDDKNIEPTPSTKSLDDKSTKKNKTDDTNIESILSTKSSDNKSSDRNKAQRDIQHDEPASSIKSSDDKPVQTSETHLDVQHEEPALSTKLSDDNSTEKSKTQINIQYEEPKLNTKLLDDATYKSQTQVDTRHEESILSIKPSNDKSTYKNKSQMDNRIEEPTIEVIQDILLFKRNQFLYPLLIVSD